MLKKITIICCLIAAGSLAQAQDVKNDVHDYLKSYQALIDNLTVNEATNNRMRVGDPNKLKNNIALTHMSEVIDAIVNGKLDECCFRAKPDVYENYANATTAQVIGGAIIPNPSDGSKFQIPPYLGKQLESLLGQTNTVVNQLDPKSQGLDEYDRMSFSIMKSLYKTNILNNMFWGWSYIDPAHSSLEASFKNYYIYSCIVCDGAGFYNTKGLYDKNPSTGKIYYDEIVTASNFPKTYKWLQQQVSKQGERPPLQSSIGITLQGQDESTEKTLSSSVIYPTHCHQAEELYFALDPMGMSKSAKSTILKGQNGYDYITNSYGIGAINLSNLPIQFKTDLSSQFPQNFMEIRNADIIYNESSAYHAFNAGRRYQFTQWSRLTWPQEGTYFPLNGGPQPPSGVTCAAKPSL